VAQLVAQFDEKFDQEVALRHSHVVNKPLDLGRSMRLVELAGGLEPPTCRLQVGCAARLRHASESLHSMPVSLGSRAGLVTGRS
jgi:hypothetical protein